MLENIIQNCIDEFHHQQSDSFDLKPPIVERQNTLNITTTTTNTLYRLEGDSAWVRACVSLTVANYSADIHK